MVSLYHRMSSTPAMRSFRIWMPKIGYSIADQALISGANFVLNILLAKWISPDSYGLFAITYSVFLFISGLHNSLLIDPLGVIGPTRFDKNPQQYLYFVVIIHLLFTALITLLLLLATPLFMWWQSGISVWVIISLCISNFAILLFWLLRRAAYMDGNAGLACLGSLFYMCCQMLGMWWLRKEGWLNVESAYFLMSVASLFAAGILWYYLKIPFAHFQHSNNQLTLKNVLSEHWQYGRWIVAGTLAYSFSTLIYVPLVGTFVGLAASGVLRAMQNLVQPVQQILVALSTFFVPWLSKQRAMRGKLYPLQVLPQMVITFSAIGIIFLLPIAFWGHELITFMYNNNYYHQYTVVLYFMVIATMFQVFVYALATIARSLEFSDSIFGQHLAGACFVLTIGIGLIWKWQLLGASVSLVGSTISQLIVMIWLIRRRLHQAKVNG